MANCTQTVVARHNYFDLTAANGDLETFDVLNHKENQKHEQKSILRNFFTYICEKKIFLKSKNPKKSIFLKLL